VSGLILTHTSSSTRVVYPVKLIASKQDVYQVGFIPKRTYTEVPLYSPHRTVSLRTLVTVFLFPENRIALTTQSRSESRMTGVRLSLVRSVNE
jgi:hypothetical protein